jgi:hypothetical protein
MSDSLWSRSLRSLAALGGEHYHPADAPSIWLFYLTIFSALSGAITSLAATRSRALWLRAHWTRGELFARVEAAFWRHNSYALGVLLCSSRSAHTSVYRHNCSVSASRCSSSAPP